MPTYSYACKDCGHAFDIVQSFADDSLTDCPSCQGSLRKLFNSVGIVFKGSGFYRTDSRTGAAAGASGSDSTVKTSSDVKTGASSATSGSDSSPASSSGPSSTGASAGSPSPVPAAKAS